MKRPPAAHFRVSDLPGLFALFVLLLLVAASGDGLLSVGKDMLWLISSCVSIW